MHTHTHRSFPICACFRLLPAPLQVEDELVVRIRDLQARVAARQLTPPADKGTRPAILARKNEMWEDAKTLIKSTREVVTTTMQSEVGSGVLRIALRSCSRARVCVWVCVGR